MATAPKNQTEDAEEEEQVVVTPGKQGEKAVIEAAPKGVEEDAHDQAKVARAISSCSLQGIHLDEADAKEQHQSGHPEAMRVRSHTTMSLASQKSIVDIITDFFQHKPNLTGEWVCIETWGLDDFLKEMGISYMKRLAATKAPWPSWEFKQDKDQINFCNHTMLGDIKEEFVADGGSYQMIDGHKQTLNCTAFWEGATLVIERAGPQGRFREERQIDANGVLNFTLKGCEPETKEWGRKFKRKG